MIFISWASNNQGILKRKGEATFRSLFRQQTFFKYAVITNAQISEPPVTSLWMGGDLASLLGMTVKLHLNNII